MSNENNLTKINNTEEDIYFISLGNPKVKLNRHIIKNKDKPYDNLNLENNINWNKNYNISMIYKTDSSSNEIKLFGESFIENNKNKVKIIINNKESNLIENLKIKKSKNEKIYKIKLKIFYN